MPRRRKYAVYLTDEDVQRLKKIIRNGKTPQTIKCRCQILLLLDLAHGQTYNYKECATMTGSCVATVSNTVKAYCTDGLEKLLVLNRSVNSDNARRKVDGRAEAQIIEVACGPVPDGRCKWTLRLLEEKSRIVLDTPVSRETIRRTLKKRASASPLRLPVPPQQRRPGIHSLYGGYLGCI